MGSEGSEGREPPAQYMVTGIGSEGSDSPNQYWCDSSYTQYRVTEVGNERRKQSERSELTAQYWVTPGWGVRK